MSESTASARPHGGRDATAILTAYLCLLWFIPSPMVVPALGSAGSPANMLGILTFMAWAWFTIRRAETLSGGFQPVRAADTSVEPWQFCWHGPGVAHHPRMRHSPGKPEP